MVLAQGPQREVALHRVKKNVDSGADCLGLKPGSVLPWTS